MRQWDQYKAVLALVAAFCFVLLTGIHAARPVVDVSGYAGLGFAPSDICGFGTGEDKGDCPNCILATGVVLLQADEPGHPYAVRGVLVADHDGWFAVTGCAAIYLARAPPYLT